jgi:hypothetical protein
MTRPAARTADHVVKAGVELRGPLQLFGARSVGTQGITGIERRRRSMSHRCAASRAACDALTGAGRPAWSGGLRSRTTRVAVRRSPVARGPRGPVRTHAIRAFGDSPTVRGGPSRSARRGRDRPVATAVIGMERSLLHSAYSPNTSKGAVPWIL